MSLTTLVAILLTIVPSRSGAVDTGPADPAVRGIAAMDTVEGVHYAVYRGDGSPSSFGELVAAALGVDAVLVGETHDDPIAHALQFELLEALHDSIAATGPVVLSLEMFESDVQYILDEYLGGQITEAQFKRSARPWTNYDTDYRPSVEFARENALPVLAANAPRRYVNRVTRMGPSSLADLSAAARAYLPPLPYAPASEAYKAEWDKLMEESMRAMRAAADSARRAAGDSARADSTSAAAPANGSHGAGSSMGYALDSQSLWDASMAYSIARALTDRPGAIVLHYAGGFHVENGTGIPEHLARYRPGTRRLIVAIRPHESFKEFDAEEFGGIGDFVILTDASLPRTQR